MSYNFNGDTPIYVQIIEQIKMLIISNNFSPGQKIPSVRELSFEFEVNPNTVQKALFELENMGLIFTERTNGKFVTTNQKLIEKIKQQTISKMLDEFCKSMAKIGIKQDEILEILKNKKGDK